MVGGLMFTGIIEQCAKVVSCDFTQSTGFLELDNPFLPVELGESIAINGVCLTVEKISPHTISFALSSETLKLTNLKFLKPGSSVNCERALLASARMGGHYVTGHVDTTKSIIKLNPQGQCLEIQVGNFSHYELGLLIPKGSITLDGVSLTINSIEKNSISLMLIPHTLMNTTLCNAEEGYELNIEFDYIARIVAHQHSIYHQLTNEKPL